MTKHTFAAAAAFAAFAAVGTHAQVVRQDMPGVRNMTQVMPTVACAGATDASAIPEIARRGFKAIISLRLASEEGANIDEAKKAAAAAGIRYVHIPFEVAKPTDAVVDQFLAALADEGNLPVFIHCGSANRVAGLWMVKRVVVDNWDLAKAESEARDIGLSNPVIRDFARAQIEKRKG
ncbi:MAG: sulfur transferase domain-containing protein [Acidobacteriota bacterium]|nr:sulfur transferase domain-containing protein [Acidobacteriota bacterium]